jgi:polyphenol oxidase
LREAAGEGEVMAWLGPCIGPQAFEVGEEVCEAFVLADHETVAHFWPLGHGKFLADLPALARRRLQRAGITDVHGNDGSPDWCTVTQRSRFFSHRRDAVQLGSAGRMAACVWIA